MQTQTTNMAALLGDPAERYFSEGFKHFDIRFASFDRTDSTISGMLLASYHGPARPRGEAVHLGSIEYLAVALRLGSIALNHIGRIGLADIARSFMSSYSIKVQETLYLGEIPFSCTLLSSERDMKSSQGSRAYFGITIGANKITMGVDHRGGGRYRMLPEEETLSPRHEQMHSLGYRYSEVDIDLVAVEPSLAKISAEVSYRSRLEENILHGFSSARELLLPTDATQVFGQLMQALLYGMEGTDRQKCPNIWLRKMALACDWPTLSSSCPAEVKFDRIRRVAKDGRQWQLIELSGNVGSYEGKFEVAHEIHSP